MNGAPNEEGAAERERFEALLIDFGDLCADPRTGLNGLILKARAAVLAAYDADRAARTEATKAEPVAYGRFDEGRKEPSSYASLTEGPHKFPGTWVGLVRIDALDAQQPASTDYLRGTPSAMFPEGEPASTESAEPKCPMCGSSECPRAAGPWNKCSGAMKIVPAILEAPAAVEGAIRDALIRLGWTPPGPVDPRDQMDFDDMITGRPVFGQPRSDHAPGDGS